ncbi:N-acetyltransferase esco2 [Mortierella alpina]|nr:N-acetyltransferase esco2 [Mortierella alpina]
MNSPASSRSSKTSDFSSTSGPETPHREYRFHKAVRNTYGRAARSALDSPSSPDFWSSPKTPANASSSPLDQGRSRLSGSFSGPFSGVTASDPWDTPTRGTRTLAERLERAKLEFDSDDDELFNKNPLDRFDGDDDLHNVFKVKDTKKDADQSRIVTEHNQHKASRTPSKRKQQFVEVQIPVRNSPRRRKILAHEEDDDNDVPGRRNKTTGMSPHSSPSPPASPSQRSRRATFHLPTPASSATSTSSNKSKAADSTHVKSSKQPTHQATISSFFTRKASNGTGILKTKASSKSDYNTEAETASPTSNRRSGKQPASLPTEPTVKLEQLFLSFSKDRTKTLSSPSNTSPAPNRTPKSSLQREDEKSKRYHCPQCGMPFVRGQQEDEQIHDRYHRAVLGGVDYPGYKNEVVVALFNDPDFGHGDRNNRRFSNTGKGHNSSNIDSSFDSVLSGSRIVMVSMSDSGRSHPAASGGSTSEKKKVKEVLQMMNNELGSVDFDPEQLEACKVFLYISGKKKVVGCVIAERIKQGYEILSLSAEGSIPDCDPVSTDAAMAKAKAATSTLTTPATSAMSTRGTTDSTVSSQGHDEGGKEDESSAIFCSVVPQPAICGINRIWVSRHYRRQKIASRMLDAVRSRFIYACKLDKKDLAFSQPTGDGKALAKQYLGTETFLVYVE